MKYRTIIEEGLLREAADNFKFVQALWQIPDDWPMAIKSKSKITGTDRGDVSVYITKKFATGSVGKSRPKIKKGMVMSRDTLSLFFDDADLLIKHKDIIRPTKDQAGEF